MPQTSRRTGAGRGPADDPAGPEPTVRPSAQVTARHGPKAPRAARLRAPPTEQPTLPPRRAASDNDFGRTGLSRWRAPCCRARPDRRPAARDRRASCSGCSCASWAALGCRRRSTAGRAWRPVRPAVLNGLWRSGWSSLGAVWVGGGRREPPGPAPRRPSGGSARSVARSSACSPSPSPRRWPWPPGPLRPGRAGPPVFKCDKDTRCATRRPDASRQPRGARRAAPSKDKPRVNILLLGGDAGKDRTGTRTDTVILASIDTKTGDTTPVQPPAQHGPDALPEQVAATPVLPERVHQR